MPPFTELPNDPDAENAFLASCLIDPDAAKTWRDGVQPGDFFIIRNQDLWRVVQGLARRGLAADWISVQHALGENDYVRYGGDTWLSELSGALPSALNVDAYAGIVRGMAERRRIIRACEAAAKAAFDRKQSLDQVRNTVLQETGSALGVSNGEARSQRDVVQDILKRLEGIDAGEIDPHGLSTGLLDLDKLTDGLFRANLTIVAGRPGMGKSGLLESIGDHVSRKEKGRVLVFSLEMEDLVWTGRVLSAVAGVDSRKVTRLGGLDAEEWMRVIERGKQLSDATMWIDDTRGLTDVDIRTRARKLAGEVGGLDLVIVDHLTLMKSTRRWDRYSREVGSNSLSLREMSKELNCHVMAAAQLNRNLEDRADKHPQLSDLKESGEIEENSDNVWLLYRDEYYDRDTSRKGIAEIDAQKNRHGPPGRVEVAYDPVRQRFSSLVRSEIV